LIWGGSKAMGLRLQEGGRGEKKKKKSNQGGLVVDQRGTITRKVFPGEINLSRKLGVGLLGAL